MLCAIQNETGAYACDKESHDDCLLREVREFAKKYNIHTVVPLDTKDIRVAHWVRLKCKFGCQKYGKSWCCPPETPTPEKTEALLKEYRKALLLCGRSRNGDFYKDNAKKRKIQVNTWKGTVALERFLFLSGYYKAFGLVSESCALCRKCAYPLECKFPMDRRPSVESCSIDIFQTLNNIGERFEIAKNVNDEYNCYSIVLLE
jgi:predicted metal-binding protein